MFCIRSTITGMYFKEIYVNGEKHYLSSVDQSDIRYGDLPSLFTEDFDIKSIEHQLKGHTLDEIEEVSVTIEIDE